MVSRPQSLSPYNVFIFNQRVSKQKTKIEKMFNLSINELILFDSFITFKLHIILQIKR